MQDNEILIISDDLDFFSLIQDAIQKSNIGICQMVSVAEALYDFAHQAYCLIIIDIPYNEIEMLEIIKTLRKSQTAPILVLIEKVNVKSKIELFHAGANACIEKSIDLSLCIAQAISLIQLYREEWAQNRKHQTLSFGTELLIDPMYRQVIIDGEPLALTRTEFDLFFCLAQRPCQIWSRTQLYRHVWSDDLGINGDNTVKTHIGNLKKKLGDLGKNYIQNSRGVGYKFVPPVCNS